MAINDGHETQCLFVKQIYKNCGLINPHSEKILDEIWLVPKLTKNKELKQLGSRIKKMRLRAKLSGRQLAFEINVNEKNLRLFEKGEVNFGVLTLYKLAEALNVEVGDFFID